MKQHLLISVKAGNKEFIWANFKKWLEGPLKKQHILRLPALNFNLDWAWQIHFNSHYRILLDLCVKKDSKAACGCIEVVVFSGVCLSQSMSSGTGTTHWLFLRNSGN